MNNTKKISFALFVFFNVAVPAHAVESIHTYTLTELKQVVSNTPECSAVYENLQQLSQPFELDFTEQEKGTHSVQSNTELLKNHTHTTLKQTMDGNKVHRIGMGSFELAGEKIDYVMQVTGHADNADHQYLYPITLSSHHASCYYTALVKPSEDTVSDFKKDIESGAVKGGTDLE